MAPPLSSITNRAPTNRSDSTYHRLEIPKTSIMPPLTGRSPALIGPPTMLGMHDRRISMHDAALDMLHSTYPPAFAQAQPQQQQVPVPHIYGKGKEREHSTPAPPQPPAAPNGFVFQRYVGYVCYACGRACQKPYAHRTLPDGGGCVDLGSYQVSELMGPPPPSAPLPQQPPPLAVPIHPPPPLDPLSNPPGPPPPAPPAQVGRWQWVPAEVPVAPRETDTAVNIDEHRRVSHGAGLFF